jgi:hypothetical protein
MSMPTKNKLSPTMIKIEAAAKPRKAGHPIGAMLRFIANTIRTIGNTDRVVSFNLVRTFTDAAPWDR